MTKQLVLLMSALLLASPLQAQRMSDEPTKCAFFFSEVQSSMLEQRYADTLSQELCQRPVPQIKEARLLRIAFLNERTNTVLKAFLVLRIMTLDGVIQDFGLDTSYLTTSNLAERYGRTTAGDVRQLLVPAWQKQAY